MLPIKFEDERVESTARLRALGAVRDDDGNLIGGGRGGKLLCQETAGVPGAHRRAGRGSAVECGMRITGNWYHVAELERIAQGLSRMNPDQWPVYG